MEEDQTVRVETPQLSPEVIINTHEELEIGESNETKTQLVPPQSLEVDISNNEVGEVSVTKSDGSESIEENVKSECEDGEVNNDVNVNNDNNHKVEIGLSKTETTTIKTEEKDEKDEKQRKTKYKRKIFERDQRIHELEKENGTATLQLNTMKHKLEEKEREITKIARDRDMKIATVTSQLNLLKQNFFDSEKQLQKQLLTVKQKNSDLQKLQHDINDLEVKSNDLKVENTTLKQSLLSAENEIRSLLLQIDELTLKISSFPSSPPLPPSPSSPPNIEDNNFDDDLSNIRHSEIEDSQKSGDNSSNMQNNDDDNNNNVQIGENDEEKEDEERGFIVIDDDDDDEIIINDGNTTVITSINNENNENDDDNKKKEKDGNVEDGDDNLDEISTLMMKWKMKFEDANHHRANYDVLLKAIFFRPIEHFDVTSSSSSSSSSPSSTSSSSSASMLFDQIVLNYHHHHRHQFNNNKNNNNNNDDNNDNDNNDIEIIKVEEEGKEEGEEREEELFNNIYKAMCEIIIRSRSSFNELGYWFSTSFTLLCMMKEFEEFGFADFPEDILQIMKNERGYSANENERRLQELSICSLNAFLFLSCKKIHRLVLGLFFFDQIVADQLNVYLNYHHSYYHNQSSLSLHDLQSSSSSLNGDVQNYNDDNNNDNNNNVQPPKESGKKGTSSSSSSSSNVILNWNQINNPQQAAVNNIFFINKYVYYAPPLTTSPQTNNTMTSLSSPSPISNYDQFKVEGMRNLMNEWMKRMKEMITIVGSYRWPHVLIHFVFQNIFVFINSVVVNSIIQSNSAFLLSSKFANHLRFVLNLLIHCAREIGMTSNKQKRESQKFDNDQQEGEEPFKWSFYGELLEYFSLNFLLEITEIADLILFLTNPKSEKIIKAENSNSYFTLKFPNLNIAQIKHISSLLPVSSFMRKTEGVSKTVLKAINTQFDATPNASHLPLLLSPLSSV